MFKNKKGFTLVELLVVIVIICILSTLAVVALNSARAKARDAKRVADIKTVQNSLELYFSDRNRYPDNNGNGFAAVVIGSANYDVFCDTLVGIQADTTGCAADKIYLNPSPANPTPNGADYAYTAAAGGATYSITFTLESGTGTLAAGAHTANPSGIQ